MKKIIISVISVILIFVSVAVNVVATTEEAAYNWYLKRNKTGAPSFPPEKEFVSMHNGYYIDNSGEKKLYLTFDAGYENGNIEKILDILKEENVKGAFFVLSNIILKNTELIKRMKEEGHLVCNHTKNHKDLTKMCEEEIENNLIALENLYEEKTGYKMDRYFRFPEGKYSKQAILTVEKLGYKTVFWSMAYADWDDKKQPSCDYAMNKLLSTTHPGAIILLHPTSSTNAAILKSVIVKWKDMGYSFGTLDELA